MTAPIQHIEAYIPQRPPVVMIDRLLCSDEDKTRTELMVKTTTLFVENGQLSASGLAENMAQTAASRAGYTFVTNNLPVKLGFIGAIKGLKIHRKPKVGEILVTEVREQSMIMNISSVECTIHVADELVAECELKIFIKE